MFIEAILGSSLVRTHSELKVSHVAGSQLNSHEDLRSWIVLPYNDTQAVLPPIFVVAWEWSIKGISANTTLAIVFLPLAIESAAIQLMIVVIGRCLKAISPS